MQLNEVINAFCGISRCRKPNQTLEAHGEGPNLPGTTDTTAPPAGDGRAAQLQYPEHGGKWSHPTNKIILKCSFTFYHLLEILPGQAASSPQV